MATNKDNKSKKTDAAARAQDKRNEGGAPGDEMTTQDAVQKGQELAEQNLAAEDQHNEENRRRDNERLEEQKSRADRGVAGPEPTQQPATPDEDADIFSDEEPTKAPEKK
jgi:hypothetical protein